MGTKTSVHSVRRFASNLFQTCHLYVQYYGEVSGIVLVRAGVEVEQRARREKELVDSPIVLL